MHINYSKKSLFISLIFSLIVFVFYALYLFKTPNYNRITQKIQKNLNYNYNILKKNTNEIKQKFNIKNQLYQKLYQDNLINNEDFTFLIFENDSLIFWANNFFNTEYLHINDYKQNLLIHSQNGYYASYVIDEHPLNFVGLFHIKNDYPYQNQFLINNFNHKLYHKPLDAVLNFDKGNYNIFIDGNQFLFSINFISGIKISPMQESIFFALFFILYILLILNLWYYVFLALKINIQLKFVLFISMLLAIKYLLLYFQYPAYIYKLEIFSPQYFASSNLFPSLGDLILTVSTFFVFISLIYKEKPKNRKIIIVSKLLNVFLIIVCICCAFLINYFAYYAFEKFILNSNIYILYNNFFELNLYSFWSALVFFMFFVGAFYFSCVLLDYALFKSSGFKVINFTIILIAIFFILLFAFFSLN